MAESKGFSLQYVITLRVAVTNDTERHFEKNDELKVKPAGADNQHRHRNYVSLQCQLRDSVRWAPHSEPWRHGASTAVCWPASMITPKNTAAANSPVCVPWGSVILDFFHNSLTG